MTFEEKKLRALRLLLLLLGAALFMSHFLRYPSQVRDIHGRFAPEATLSYPSAYVLFAPFSQAADALTLLSLYQHIMFLLFLNALWLSFRVYLHWGTPQNPQKFVLELLKGVAFNLCYAAAAAAAILAPRPMASLDLRGPDILAVDFHSHTSHSWDARRSFSPFKNLEWHRRAGFDAAFITDHNAVSGADEAVADYERGSKSGAIPLRGEEVSLFKSHWVVLGNKSLIPNHTYDTGPEGIQRFLADVTRSTGVCVIASLPEYWQHHWADIEQLVRWGAQGFEIVNSAPIALDFPRSKRGEVLKITERENLARVGITDNHGWGSAAYVWNTLEIPGWRDLSRAELEEKIIQILRDNPQGVQVWTRVKQEPGEEAWAPAADPLLQIWENARSLPALQRVIALLWISGFGWLVTLLSRSGTFRWLL